MRMRKKPNLIPRMERCAHLLVTDPEARRGNWRALKPGCQALHVELGCGKGRFTAETAALNPDTLFVALEKVNDAMVVAMERADRMGLDNVFFLSADASHLADYFAPGEIDRLYINFCDPWPSRRHAKRRLTAPGFLHLYRTAMAPQGSIHFKTDNRPLFDWSLDQFTFCGWHVAQLTHDLHKDGPTGVMTDYECKFYEQGVPINRCVAERLC